jgi:hypothetical protein
MNKPAPKGLQITFLVHAILSLILGLSLLLVPGRSLALSGWVEEWVQLPNSDQIIPGYTFVDPLITRLLGAALLALAYLSFRCLRSVAQVGKDVRLVVEFEAVYCALSIIAILIALITMERIAGVIVWLILLLYAAFFVAWGIFWQSQRKQAA